MRPRTFADVAAVNGGLQYQVQKRQNCQVSRVKCQKDVTDDLNDVQRQQYADDTQLYIFLAPLDPRNELNGLHTCLMSLQTWFYTNGMALNPETSTAILLRTAQRASSYSRLTSFDVAGSVIFVNEN